MITHFVATSEKTIAAKNIQLTILIKVKNYTCDNHMYRNYRTLNASVLLFSAVLCFECDLKVKQKC